VAGFVHRDPLPFRGVEPRLPHVAQHDLVVGLGKVPGLDGLGIPARRRQRHFVDELAGSAPEKPGLLSATESRSTSVASGWLRAWMPRIARRLARSGRSTTMRRSKRPGRSSAGSGTSGWLIAARAMVSSLRTKPSISERSWFKVCSRSSCPPPKPVPRESPTASVWSPNPIDGASFFASSNSERTRDAPTPTNSSMHSEALMEK
jgi:hypothetical protein